MKLYLTLEDGENKVERVVQVKKDEPLQGESQINNIVASMIDTLINHDI